MWEDDEYSVRQAVSDALIGMGAASVPAVDAAMQSESWRIRRNPAGTGIYPVFGIDRTNGPELGPRESVAGRLTCARDLTDFLSYIG